MVTVSQAHDTTQQAIMDADAYMNADLGALNDAAAGVGAGAGAGAGADVSYDDVGAGGGGGGDYGDDNFGLDDVDEMDEAVDGIPEWANEDNRDLHAAVVGKENRIAECEKHVGEHSERVGIMDEHLRNVQQELSHTQRLVDAKNKEIETEDHLKQLAEREAGRIRQELQKLDVRAEEVQDELNVVQNHIFRGNEQMDRFKLQMNWNQEELEQWVSKRVTQSHTLAALA